MNYGPARVRVLYKYQLDFFLKKKKMHWFVFYVLKDELSYYNRSIIFNDFPNKGLPKRVKMRVCMAKLFIN